MNKFQKVISQIELFIRKYYTNEMVKGGILFLAVLLFTYLTVSGLEYVGRFGSTVRLGLLLGFIGVNVFLLVRFIIKPILKLNKLGRHLSLLEASEMIGSIFPDIGDKLKNTLQLDREKNNSSLNLELVQASIEQRSSSLSVIPFATAIDLKENKKYLKYLIPVLLLFTSVAILNPNLFSEGTERVIYFNEEFVEPAPFDFILESRKESREGEDYLLEILLQGEEIPNEMKIHSNMGTYNLSQKSKVKFEHEFSNLNKDLTFYCEANGFKSEEFSVKVLKKPVLEELNLNVVYPRHTHKKNERFENTGDITIPEGSLVEWNITARNLKELKAYFKDTSFAMNTSLSKNYRFKKKFFQSEEYLLSISSDEIENADSLFYNIAVVPDEYPKIAVTEEIDSTNNLKRFFEGKISDDYGYRGLRANIKIVGKDTSYQVGENLRINPNITNQMFSFYIDLSVFDLGPGDRIEYSFSITDNDEINGFKTTSSSKRIYSVPDMDELDNMLSDQSEKIKNELDEALKESEDIKKKIQELKSEMLNKPNLDWKDKQNLQNLLNMQKQLDQKIENLKSEYEKNKNDQDNLLNNSPELEEKQEQLEQLLNELMDEELLELFEELQKLMEEMNKDSLIENLEDLERKTENLEDEIDRSLELFKNMELDQKLENLEEQLRDLAEEQEELEEMTDDKNISPEELAAKQDSINKKFDEIQKDIDDIKEKNEELENPRDLDFNEEQENQIDQELNDSKENLENNKRSKSQENQKNASEMMQQMADDVAAMQMQMQAQQQGEDMDALRYLLENIVRLSKEQEALMDEYAVTSTTDPYYLELNRKQIDIQSATEIVNDSLVALSKRVYQLSSFITEELSNLNYNLDKSLEYSEARNINSTKQHQQYAMTSYNELALMLSEVLQQMQDQAQAKMPGNGSCNNPGGSGQGKSGQMTMQQMKDAMKDQINQMKGGQKPGGQDGQNKQGDGNGQGPGENGKIPGLSNKEIAKMAAQQSMIRESLKQLREELNKDGSGLGNELNELINELDELEKDLLNGEYGPDLLKRQEEIYSRLLESEKALRERGYSEERESEEGKNNVEGNKIEFTEYNRKKNAEIEFLRSLPVELQVYYRHLVNEYFNSVNN